MRDQLIAALDIGSSKIASVIGLKSEETQELRIIGFNSTPSRGVKKGLVVDIDQVSSAIEESVEKTERMAGHKMSHVLVSVGGPHITSLNSHGVVAVSNPQAEISQEDVARVVEAASAISLSQTKQIIDVSSRDFIVDGQPGIKNPVGMTGVRLEVDTHIITASLTNLKNIDRCLSDLGLENAGYVFCGLASAESTLTDTEKELGVALVDIGGGKIDICLFVDGSLSYSASIQIGARHITNDIAVGLRVSLDSAEKIKLHLGKTQAKFDKLRKKDDILDLKTLGLEEGANDVSLKTLVDGIIAPRLEEMYRMIFEEIEKSGFLESIPSGLVITGGGALTLGMLEAGKRVIGLPIRIGVPEGINGLVDEILNPQYATTIGLLLHEEKNIIEKPQWKDFDKILKDFSLSGSVTKVKNFFKQFIP